jgi:hypothetical protein
MATTAATVLAVRRILGENPENVHLNGSIANTTEETVVVDSTDIAKVAVGQVLEHETGGELRYVVSVDEDTSGFEAYRGYLGSTAATQADNSFMWINPRFPYVAIEQALDAVLDVDLFNEGLWDLNEHTVTSNSDSTRDYNAPSANCEQFLSIYQFTALMTEPRWLLADEFSRYPRNVDTTHHATGKMFTIKENFGTAGTDPYYVTCAHRLAIGTLNARQEHIVQWLTCARLLEQEDAKRTGQNTTQGDRTVRVGQRVQTAAYYRGLAEKAINDERSEVKKLLPPGRVWKARSGRRFP